MKSMLIANICPPTKILGVTVYNPLPAKHFVDLDHECVIPIGGPIHPHDIDDIIEDIQRAGTLPNGVAWGITSRNDRGFANILVDADEVDEKTIEHLIEMKVVITPKTCRVWDKSRGPYVQQAWGWWKIPTLNC